MKCIKGTKKLFSSAIINTNIPHYYTEYIELRSDVKTLPTKKMLDSVNHYNYGDDIFQEDPTVKLLEKKFADLFKMSTALFCPSGTMANMVSLRVNADFDDGIILGDRSHMSIIEKDQLEFIRFRPIRLKNEDNGTININTDYINKELNSNKDLISKVKVVCLEDTHNFCGGAVLQRGFREKLHNTLSTYLKHNIFYHLDGSRVLNSAVAQKLAPSELVQGFDTVNVCLSKGLGAPCGSIVIMKNPNDYVKARHWRKVFGGAMRQVGFLAAPALVALEDYEERFIEDHKNAALFEKMIKAGSNRFIIKQPCQTNIVNLYCHTKDKEKLPDFVVLLREKHRILINPYPDYLRAVFHHQVSNEQTKRAAEAIVKEANVYFN